MRRLTPAFSIALLTLVLVAVSISGSLAARHLPPETFAETLVKAARAALAKGVPDDAEFLLKGIKPGEGNADDLDFLHASIAMARGEWQSAISRFRAMLARNPNLPRVRLYLALAYFNAEEDGNAAHHFRLALGDDDLPPVVRGRALAFLDRIRRRKSWSVTGSVAFVPDSNINVATSARQVELFGLPATLSEDARKTSGVGVSANVSGGYEGRISPDLRFRVAGGLRTRTYREDQFNERIVSLRAGPRCLFEKFDLRPEVTLQRRWLGADAYSRANGIQLSGNWLIGDAWRLGASAGREWVDYETFLGEGNIDSTGVNLAHALGKATLLRADTAFRRETLDLDAYSWREFIAGISASRELPRGFVVSGGPSYRWREYGAPLAAFGPDARRDRTLAGRITVSNRLRHGRIENMWPRRSGTYTGPRTPMPAWRRWRPSRPAPGARNIRPSHRAGGATGNTSRPSLSSPRRYAGLSTPQTPSSRSTPRSGALSAPAATSPVTRPPRSCYISFSIMRPRRGNDRRGNGSRPKHNSPSSSAKGSSMSDKTARA